MPTYSVQLNVNVPSVGDKNLVQTGITAPDYINAVAQATANIIITVLAVQRTAP